MAEPQTLGSEALVRRIGAILAARGLADLEPGPIDDAPTPNEPGHPEYHRRQRTEIALKRWQNATPRRYQEATATHPDVIAWADRAITDLDTAGILVLIGTIGTGKTHQAYGALRRIAEAGPRRYELVATTAADMYGTLRPGGPGHDTEHELRRLTTVPLLLVDDIDVAKSSEWVEEVTYRIFNERYNECRPAIFTSNLLIVDPDGGPDLASKLGDRITSRLAQMTTVVPIVGPDRRREHR